MSGFAGANRSAMRGPGDYGEGGWATELARGLAVETENAFSDYGKRQQRL